MKVLIVEDDEFKSTQLVKFIRSHYQYANIETRVSYQSGLCEAVEGKPDLVLLDMNLPNFDPTGLDEGYKTLFFAGRDILQELDRLKVKANVIIVTQFEQFGEGKDVTTLGELSQTLSEKYGGNYRGTVYYHPAQEDWKSSLLDIIQKGCC